MAEFSELNDKLADIRSAKTKVSRMLREKEEEMGRTNILCHFECRRVVTFMFYVVVTFDKGECRLIVSFFEISHADIGQFEFTFWRPCWGTYLCI